MPPTLPDERTHLRRGRLLTGLAAALLVGVLALVWALGGFGRRQDLVSTVAPGTVVSTGPYELAFNGATVQHLRDTDRYKVVVTGTGRTTGDVTIQPPLGNDGFLSADASGSAEYQPVTSVQLGEVGGYALDQHRFVPGLPPVPVTLTLTFTSDPGATMRLFVFDQEYTTPWLFSDDKGWQTTREAHKMLLPLRALPDAQY